MRVPQRLDYAMRALILLAEQERGAWVAAGELADRLRLPRRFVEQQVTTLARSGIVECRRGAAGGCALSRSASEITIRQVVLALQGEILDVPRQSDSASAELWQQAEVALSEFLDNVTLEELAKRQRELDSAAAPMYYI
jgi:Rrf2 family protein